MHELSIAMSIVDICNEELHKAGSSRVTQVEVEIGSLSGVETAALEFSWDAAINKTPVEGATLLIRKVQATAKCNECQAEFEIDNYFSPCSECGAFGYAVARGKELQIIAIIVE
jgi:hydrogenase nickel incorporation protein HypA/HybF